MANPGISDFSRRFSAALQGVMREKKLRIEDVARTAGRSKGFVSEHTSGKAAPDTDLVDAVAQSIGMTTHALVQEIVRRMEPEQRLLDVGYRRLALGDAAAPRSAAELTEGELDEARRIGELTRDAALGAMPRLRSLLVEAGVSDGDLAMVLGLRPATVADWWRLGMKQPLSPGQLDQIAWAAHQPVDRVRRAMVIDMGWATEDEPESQVVSRAADAAG